MTPGPFAKEGLAERPRRRGAAGRREARTQGAPIRRYGRDRGRSLAAIRRSRRLSPVSPTPPSPGRPGSVALGARPWTTGATRRERDRRSVRPAYALRCSRRTGWPTASHIRRTWRLRPSCKTSSSRDGASSRTRAGAVGAVVELDSLRQAPHRRDRDTALDVCHVRLCDAVAWMGEAGASCPSFVSRSAPFVSASRRPTGTTRAAAGRARRRSDDPVGRARWSRRRPACGAARAPEAAGPTGCRRPRPCPTQCTDACSSPRTPFTITRPSRISSSAPPA